MRFTKPALPDAEVYLCSGFIGGQLSDYFLAALISQVNWKQETIRLFGREVMQPRLVAWYGDPGCAYTYSGRTNSPQSWTEPLLEIRSLVIEATSSLIPEFNSPGFNSVLLNRYRDGNDSMGWHSDNERELGPEPLIASVSFGSPRSFCLRHIERKDQHSEQLILGHGDLLVMAGKTQAYWKHQVPRTRKPVGERVNLTFRHILSDVQR